METEGLSFPEAVERLARDAGLDLPVVSEEAQRAGEAPDRAAGGAGALAAAFFQQQLQGRAGAKARGYLADRGLGPDVQAQFRIGYAPAERFALRDQLAGKGVQRRDHDARAGLLIHGEDIAVPYDRFRDRVMFPICDRSRPGDRLRRARAGEGRSGQVPELAGDAALPQGRDALQPPQRPQAGP